MAGKDVLNASIEDYLLSLGHSLHSAQRQLSGMATAVVPGDAPVTYHIPRLDFEFKVAMDLPPPDSGEAARIAIRPVQGGEHGNATFDAASVIKGSFVAVPLRSGKPPPQLRTEVTQIAGRGLQIRAELRSSAGEAVAGVEVHFNIDPDASRALAEATGASFQLAPRTGFQVGRTTTDADGVTHNGLFVDATQLGPTPLILLVEAQGVSERVLYTIPSSAPADAR